MTFAQDTDFHLADIMNYLSVSMGSAHSYVADILARRKETMKMIAFRLGLLGWTNEEVGEAIDMNRNAVNDFQQNFSELKKSVKNLLTEGHPHEEVAKRQNMQAQLVWAIDMEGRTDKDRMAKLGINIQPYDVWNFATCHELFGTQHPGRIPGQIVAHVLYFYPRQTHRKVIARADAIQRYVCTFVA